MEQRSEEWFMARLSKVTASRISDVLATTKNGEAATRSNYRIQLVTERLTNEPTKTYVNEAMQHGIDTEDEARAFYMFSKADVEEVGFIDHPTIKWSGASPRHGSGWSTFGSVGSWSGGSVSRTSTSGFGSRSGVTAR